jgi:hypothetical protein
MTWLVTMNDVELFSGVVMNNMGVVGGMCKKILFMGDHMSRKHDCFFEILKN